MTCPDRDLSTCRTYRREITGTRHAYGARSCRTTTHRYDNDFVLWRASACESRMRVYGLRGERVTFVCPFGYTGTAATSPVTTTEKRGATWWRTINLKITASDFAQYPWSRVHGNSWRPLGTVEFKTRVSLRDQQDNNVHWYTMIFLGTRLVKMFRAWRTRENVKARKTALQHVISPYLLQLVLIGKPLSLVL